MIEWAYFPRNKRVTPLGKEVVDAFKAVSNTIDSAKNNHLISRSFKDASSDAVLNHVRTGLVGIGFEVETGRRATQTIPIPVLFDRDGKTSRSFYADAYHAKEGFVLEVEAGRAMRNYHVLKDLFEACVMVDAKYLAIALRRVYKTWKDFDDCYVLFDTLYVSERLKLPLEGVLLIGY